MSGYHVDAGETHFWRVNGDKVWVLGDTELVDLVTDAISKPVWSIRVPEELGGSGPPWDPAHNEDNENSGQLRYGAAVDNVQGEPEWRLLTESETQAFAAGYRESAPQASDDEIAAVAEDYVMRDLGDGYWQIARRS
jgi:hypothetical protein